MKKLTAGIFATILGLTAIDAYAAVPSQHYVDTVVAAAEGRAATDATTKAGQALQGAKTWVEEQAYLKAADISGKADTTYVDNQDAATLSAAKTYAEGVAAQAESGAVATANAYTDTKVGNLPQGTADVVTYVDAKTSGIATEKDLTALQATVAGHTTSITNLTNDKLDKSTYTTDKATFETINGAAGKYEPILDEAERAAITSGIDATKVGQIATAITNSTSALNQAETAATNALEAKNTASAANTTAGEAKTAAENAQTTANGAVTKAEGAVSTANTAKSTADAAKTAAETATTNVANLTTTVNGHTTSIDALESGKLNVVPATSETTDGQYVLTMKKSGETMTYGWELITRSEGK